MKMKASDFVAAFLHEQKIDVVFEMAGGMITHILDSLHNLNKTTIVSVHHEQAAAFAADAFGRCTGKPGVALATSGPGATNLLTGIGSCYFDSSPAVFITGQVNTHEQKGERGIRQLGFQETDIIAMATPITKKCFSIQHENEIVPAFIEAFETAMNGRPGPVLIDFPMNLQRAQIDVSAIPTIQKTNSLLPKLEPEDFKSLYEAIKKSQKPLIIAGGGINAARANSLFLNFVETLHIPVVTSLLALDSIPFEHPLRVGFFGSYGNRWANLAIGESDLLIVIGSRLDIRQTGADIDGFKKNKLIFHIDCDQHEINNRVKDCVPIIADIEDFLKQAQKEYANLSFKNNIEWSKEINILKNTWPDIEELKDIKGINPNFLMHALSQESNAAAGFIADVGNHQMWAAQSLEVHSHQFFMTSGGMGAMGFALPAAVGASLSHEKKPVVVIVGDGSFQLNIQELQTITRNNLPLKIIILNNKSLGMIRKFQDSYFEGRYQSTYWGYSAPDFEAIGLAYGIHSKTISETDEISSALKWLWEDPNEPALLQVMIDPHVNVYPKIAFGKPLTEMEPFAQPTQMEST
jgi:acetolactate synthase-1/2/3 large subunit